MGLAACAIGFGASKAHAVGCHFRERPELALAYPIPGLAGESASATWAAQDQRILLDVPVPCPADGTGRPAGVGTIGVADSAPVEHSDGEGSRFEKFDSSRPHPIRRVATIERPPRLTTN